MSIYQEYVNAATRRRKKLSESEESVKFQKIASELRNTLEDIEQSGTISEFSRDWEQLTALKSVAQRFINTSATDAESVVNACAWGVSYIRSILPYSARRFERILGYVQTEFESLIAKANVEAEEPEISGEDLGAFGQGGEEGADDLAPDDLDFPEDPGDEEEDLSAEEEIEQAIRDEIGDDDEEDES